MRVIRQPCILGEQIDESHVLDLRAPAQRTVPPSEHLIRASLRCSRPVMSSEAGRDLTRLMATSSLTSQSARLKADTNGVKTTLLRSLVEIAAQATPRPGQVSVDRAFAPPDALSGRPIGRCLEVAAFARFKLAQKTLDEVLEK